MIVEKKAFTLVELIVVITILAILWTIGFMWYQQYWVDSRNSKRTLDLSNISNLILVKEAEWILPLAFVWWNDENKLSEWFINVWWKPSNSDSYDAWILNYTALKIIKSKFQDPDWINEYRIWATTTYWWRFEIASTLEIDNDSESYIKGNYFWRWVDIIPLESVSMNVVTLWTNYSNKFKSKDTIVTNSWDTFVITKVARDSKTLTFETDMTGVSTIQLAIAETEWLLADKDDYTKVLLNKSNVTLPY